MSESLEPDFAAGDYDAGVQKTFTALYNEVCAIYGVTGSTGTVQGGGAVAAQPQPQPEESAGFGVVTLVGLLVFLVVVIVLIGVVSSAARPRRRYTYDPYYAATPARFSHRHVCGQRFARLAPQAASAPAKASTRPV